MVELPKLQTQFQSRLMELGPLTDCFRLCDTESITIDIFGSVAVVNEYEEFSNEEERALAEGVLDIWGISSVYVKRRPKEAKHRANTEIDHLSPALPLAGVAVDSLVVQENGMKFEIRPANGLSVGLYLDARALRKETKTRAFNKCVLNLFSYTCGFGVAATLGGAIKTVNIDVSGKVLDWGKANYRHNGIDLAAHGVTLAREGNTTQKAPVFWVGDAEKALEWAKKKREQFDLIILDPPGFASTRNSRFSMLSDYYRLVAKCSDVLEKEGQLLAMCNVATMGMSDLIRHLERGFGKRKFRVEQIAPPSVDFAPSHGLKALWIVS
jgi:23S rRNA (cytosine1962-C5)-methyltransferase